MSASPNGTNELFSGMRKTYLSFGRPIGYNIRQGGIMAYNELIKNFGRIRDYMREFYVYGFKSRCDYDAKSARSYDNEKRRIESFMGEYMDFQRTENGKIVFISVDCRSIPHNPLYKAFKAACFTNNDITLHFCILDILTGQTAMSLKEIADAVNDDYLAFFEEDHSIDESTIRKKLKEYENEGLLESEKQGNKLYYRRADSGDIDIDSWKDALAFFSETDPLGVIGSFIIDDAGGVPEYFSFKHSYLLHALDSEILCVLADAVMHERIAEIKVRGQRSNRVNTHNVVPLKFYISTQAGRQYLCSYDLRFKRPLFYRLDLITAVTIGGRASDVEKHLAELEEFSRHIWGTSNGRFENSELEHLEMTLKIGENESYIIDRLLREKRGGRVIKVSADTWKYEIDVLDASEMLPWIRTFTGRIAGLSCSNKNITATFYDDLETMQKMYKEVQNDI